MSVYGPTRKEKREWRDDDQRRVGAAISEKQKRENPVERFDYKIMKAGEDWYYDGFLLEEAPENLRDNINFIKGYEHAVRMQDVDDEFFRKGAKAFFDGVNWEQIPESERCNESFIQGYEDAMTIQRIKHK